MKKKTKIRERKVMINPPNYQENKDLKKRKNKNKKKNKLKIKRNKLFKRSLTNDKSILSAFICSYNIFTYF